MDYDRETVKKYSVDIVDVATMKAEADSNPVERILERVHEKINRKRDDYSAVGISSEVSFKLDGNKIIIRITPSQKDIELYKTRLRAIESEAFGGQEVECAEPDVRPY